MTTTESAAEGFLGMSDDKLMFQFQQVNHRITELIAEMDGARRKRGTLEQAEAYRARFVELHAQQQEIGERMLRACRAMADPTIPKQNQPGPADFRPALHADPPALALGHVARLESIAAAAKMLVVAIMLGVVR
jgi:hypothetical protein